MKAGARRLLALTAVLSATLVYLHLGVHSVLKTGGTSSNYFEFLDRSSEEVSCLLELLDVSDPRHAVENFDSLSYKDMVIGTAVSKNHVTELRKRLCPSKASYRGFNASFNPKLIIYLLDELPDPADVSGITKDCPSSEIRLFSPYFFPNHVRTLLTYSFKPLIIAMLLKEYRIVYWMDSSIQFNKKTDGYTMKDFVSTALKRKMGLILGGPAIHSVFAATRPSMFRYLPMEMNKSYETMREANMMLFVGTSQVKRTILRRFVQCALLEDCIAPPGSQLSCNFTGKDFYKVYVGCHRYDQSAINIIVGYYTNYNASKYLLDFSQWRCNRM